MCPYPGLARFTAANRDLLFGRDGDRDAILQRIRAEHTRILIVGPSGSGKSSLLHAGVLPELPPEGYLVQVVQRWGSLAAALRVTVDALEVPNLGRAIDDYMDAVQEVSDSQVESSRARLRATPVPDMRRRIVIVDPLEEIFATDDAAARSALFALLGGLWTLPWCTVILCMRADFYGELMAERCWRDLESCQYAVAPLDDTGLRAAIIEPARCAGVHVDAALVERLIREVDRDRSSSALPLLQVALKELWAHLHWRYLTLTDYERIVNHEQRGLAAALAVHAEAVLQRLTGLGDRTVAQRVLLDMVHLGEGRPHTRRRRTLEDLRRSGDAPDQLKRVLEILIEGRLITTSDGERASSRGDERTVDAVHDAQDGDVRNPAVVSRDRHVDLAHDALITGWPALAGWLAEHRDQLRVQRRLEARATAGPLLSSDELPEFTRWVAWTAMPAGQALGASEALRALVRRSVAARRLRRRIFGGGLIAVTGVAVVFVILFLQLREEKTKTQKSIGDAMKVAKQNVFELETRLETVGCSEAAEVRKSLLTRANELLAELSKLSPLNEDQQRTWMAAKLAQGDFARERGQLQKAGELYREVLTDAQRRTAGNRNDADWQRDLSVSYIKLGDVAMSAAKIDEARDWFRQALVVREALAARDPRNPTWLGDLEASYVRLGAVAMSASEFDAARRWFDQALMVAKALAARDPTNTDWQRDLEVSYGRLGDIAMSASKLDDANARFEQALAVAKTLAAKEPSNTTLQRDLSISYNKLGGVAVSAGQLDNAHAWFDQGLTVAKSLAANDVGNTDWQRDLSISYERLGEVAMSANEFDDARAWFDQSVAVRKALTAKDSSNTDWQWDLCTGLAKRARASLFAHVPAEATSYLDEARVIYRRLQQTGPSQHDVQFAELGKQLEQLAASIAAAPGH